MPRHESTSIGEASCLRAPQEVGARPGTRLPEKHGRARKNRRDHSRLGCRCGEDDPDPALPDHPARSRLLHRPRVQGGEPGPAPPARPEGVFSRALHHASPLADSKEDPAGAAKVIDRVLRSEDERPTPVRLLRLLVLRADVAGRLGDEETARSAPARATAVHLGARERGSVPDGLERLKEPGVRDRCESAARSRSWRLRPVRSPWIRVPAGEPGGGAALDRTGALGSPPGSARTAGYHPAARPRAAQTGAPGPARHPVATTPPDAPAGCSSGHHAPQDLVIPDRGLLPRQAPTFARGRGRRGEGRATFTRRSPRSGVPGARGGARLPWRPVC